MKKVFEVVVVVDKVLVRASKITRRLKSIDLNILVSIWKSLYENISIYINETISLEWYNIKIRIRSNWIFNRITFSKEEKKKYQVLLLILKDRQISMQTGRCELFKTDTYMLSLHQTISKTYKSFVMDVNSVSSYIGHTWK